MISRRGYEQQLKWSGAGLRHQALRGRGFVRCQIFAFSNIIFYQGRKIDLFSQHCQILVTSGLNFTPLTMKFIHGLMNSKQNCRLCVLARFNSLTNKNFFRIIFLITISVIDGWCDLAAQLKVQSSNAALIRRKRMDYRQLSQQ